MKLIIHAINKFEIEKGLENEKKKKRIEVTKTIHDNHHFLEKGISHILPGVEFEWNSFQFMSHQTKN